jgi:amyloid beta precursor protein binding protein 1
VKRLLSASYSAVFDLQNPAQLLKDEPGFFLSFTMILSVNSPPEFDLALSDLLWSGKLDSHKRQTLYS